MTRILTKIEKEQAAKESELIVRKVNHSMVEGADWCKDYHERFDENNRYVSGGTQWREGDVERQEAKGRPHFTMNKLLQVVNAIANKEITSRYVPKCYARSRGDGAVAESSDEFIRWSRDRAESEHEESAGFRAMVISGISAMHKYWDPLEEEGEGLIMDEEVPICNMLWDSRAKKQNLVDRRWHMCGKYVSRFEAEEEYGSLTPAARKYFKGLSDRVGSRFEDSDRAKSTSGRLPWDQIANGQWWNRVDDELFLVEYEWRDVKFEFKVAVPRRLEELEFLSTDPYAEVMVAEVHPDYEGMEPEIDPATGEEMPLPPWIVTGSDYAQMDDQDRAAVAMAILSDTVVKRMSSAELKELSERYFEATGDNFEDFSKLQRYVYKYAVVTDDVVLDSGEREVGFTYEFMTGFPCHSSEGTRFFGFVDVAKGPQDWRNTFMNLVLARLAHSPKQSIILEEGAVDDVDSFFDDLANPRGAATVSDGFVKEGRYLLLDPPQFPPLERELIAMADQAIVELAGLSGFELQQQSDLRRISGTVVQSVRESSNTILAILFDSLRRYRRRTGRLLLKYMHLIYTPQQVMRIVGEEKGAGLAQWEEWPEVERFDVKIDEAPVSVSERVEFFDQMTRTGSIDKWLDQDRIPFDLVIEWYPGFSEGDKERVREHAAKKDMTAQLQSQLEQLQQAVAGLPGGQEVLQQVMAGGGAAPPPAG